tara:strand:- start:5026 stop:5376 length:351 start_codon:yes stop_codon:yes gene_type:complete
MNYKSISLKRYKNRKLYRKGMYLTAGDFIKLYQKGYTVKVTQHGKKMDVIEQVELGYKLLVSQLAVHINTCSPNEIFDIGESITRVLTGRNVYEKAELSNYSNILNVLGLRTKATS